MNLMYNNPSDIKVHDHPEILNEWLPSLQGSKFVNESVSENRLNVMAKLAHIQARDGQDTAINESLPTLGTFPGQGNPSFGTTLGGQSNFVNGTPGSGDKWVSPFAIAMQASAKTVGFDLVSTIPISAPAGMIYHGDFIYADGTLSGTGANAPILFKISIGGLTPEAGDKFFGTSTSDAVAATGDAERNAAYIEYVGRSRKLGYPIFKLISTGTVINEQYTATNTLTLAQIFDGTGGIVAATDAENLAIATPTAVTTTAEYVVTMEDQVYGYANGAGGLDGVSYNGTYQDGLSLYEAGLRGEVESDQYQDLGFRIVSKMIETRSFKVSISVTQEQLTDMRKQHGFDLIAKAEQALVNEVSQNINRNILARAFALGWTHHYAITLAEGANFNVSLDATYTSNAVNATYSNNAGTSQAISIPYWTNFSSSTASWDNQETVQRRLVSKINAASDMLMQRNRIGAATGIITNTQIASALKNIASYTPTPFANKLATTGGTLYPAGSIADMQIYVDPNMRYNDTRVCVFRKGADDEPGLKFLPYLIGESVSTINPNTAAPRIFVSSRYALTEYGQHPEMHYLTFFVKLPAGGIV